MNIQLVLVLSFDILLFQEAWHIVFLVASKRIMSLYRCSCCKLIHVVLSSSTHHTEWVNLLHWSLEISLEGIGSHRRSSHHVSLESIILWYRLLLCIELLLLLWNGEGVHSTKLLLMLLLLLNLLLFFFHFLL
jgi:hypothetical protein